MLRWLTAGESHGPALVAILEGLPAGVSVTTADIDRDLARRRLGVGRGARMKFEQDEVRIVGRRTPRLDARRTGRDRGRQHRVAEVGQGHVAGPGRPGRARRASPATRRSPGPGPVTPTSSGMQKYAFDDARPVLERASARETAARVALGAVAKAFLAQTVGSQRAVPRRRARHRRRAGRARAVARRPRRASTPTRSAASTVARASAMVAEVDAARQDGDTLGGVVEVRRPRPPAGPRQPRALGPPARRAPRRRAHGHPGHQGRRGRRRLRARAHAAGRRRTTRSCRATHGVARGLGPRRRHRGRHVDRRGAARPRGDEADLDDPAGAAHRRRRHRRARPAINQRSDVCAVPAAGVVAEAMVALVLADAVLEKFGGDSVGETARNVAAYRAALVVS